MGATRCCTSFRCCGCTIHAAPVCKMWLAAYVTRAFQAVHDAGDRTGGEPGQLRQAARRRRSMLAQQPETLPLSGGHAQVGRHDLVKKTIASLNSRPIRSPWGARAAAVAGVDFFVAIYLISRYSVTRYIVAGIKYAVKCIVPKRRPLSGLLRAVLFISVAALPCLPRSLPRLPPESAFRVPAWLRSCFLPVAIAAPRRCSPCSPTPASLRI